MLYPLEKLIQKYIHFILLLCILILSFRISYINPSSLADLRPWPDALEYSLSAYNLYHHHIYGIKLYGQYYSPQYPYGYPLLIIPFYIIFGSQPYKAVYCSLFFALLSIVFAYLIGKKLGNRGTGLIAALFVALCFRHIEFSKYIMSETSSAFFTLLICWLLLKVIDFNSRKKRLLLLLLGLITGFSVSVHLTNLLLIPPVLISFLLGRESHLSSLLKRETIILFGIILALIPLFIYQFNTFGSPLKSGYQVAHPELFGKFKSFSLKFFAHPHDNYKRGNFIALLFALSGLEKHLYPPSMVPLLLGGVLFILAKRREHNKQNIFLIFLFIFLSSQFVFLLFYMSQHVRHLLKVGLLLMILAAYGITFLINKLAFKPFTKESIVSLTILGLFLMTIIQMGFWNYSLPKSSLWIDNRQYKLIQDTIKHIPKNAIVISQFNPIVAEYYFTEHPADRRVYISLSITPYWAKIEKSQSKPIRYDKEKKYSFLFLPRQNLNPRTYNFIRLSLQRGVPVYLIYLPYHPVCKRLLPIVKRYFIWTFEQEGDIKLFRLYLKDW